MKTGIIISIIVAVAIIVATYFINGAEKETAWLYILALWLVLLPVIDEYFRKKNKDQ